MEHLKHKTVLLAGASGYLGNYILHELLAHDICTNIIVRKASKNKLNFEKPVKIIEAEITKAATLKNSCLNIDIVISTVGITRQKDGLSYIDVDYQANLNLLQEAKKANVEKFIYVSAINGDKYRHLKIFQAKEKFVDALKASGLNYTIVRPNGFFSDMKNFLAMANTGKVYLFGNGEQKFNPIHGQDLAFAILNNIAKNNPEFNIGGPDVLSLNEIARLAFTSLNKPVKIIHLPDWTRKLTLWILRTFTSVKTYGPLEFFLTLMAEDNIAPTYGTQRLRTFYKKSATKL
ncbi:SDR family oxidoreductase [Wenyingzhuangia sp. IMCC45574]